MSRRSAWRVVLVVVALWLSASLALAANITKWKAGTQSTLLGAELNNIAPGGYTGLSTTYNNAQGQTPDGYALCILEGRFTFVANPTAGTGVLVWLLHAPDGTNYEDTPSASVALGRMPNAVLPVTAGQVSTRISKTIVCPAGLVKGIAKNESGQAMTASGNTVKITPLTLESN